MMQRTGEVFQVSAGSNFEKKMQPGGAAAASSAASVPGQANPPMSEPHGKEQTYAPHLSTLTTEKQLSSTGAQQAAPGGVPLSKHHLKLQQQLKSEQTGSAMHGQGLTGTSPRVGQGIFSVGQASASGPPQKDRPDNSTNLGHQQHVNAARQILQSGVHQYQMAPMATNQAAGVFTSRDPQFSKKTTAALNLFEKQGSSSVFPGVGGSDSQKEAINAVPTEKGGGDIHNTFGSRSPHSQKTKNILSFSGQQQAIQKSQASTANTQILGSQVGLALNYTFSDSKRPQANVSSAAMQPERRTKYGSWGNNVIEAAGTTQQQMQQRAAGKASGASYTLHEHGKVEQTNSSQWNFQSTSDEKGGGGGGLQKHHNKILTQAGQQQQMNFQRERLKAMHQRGQNFGPDGGSFMSQVSSGAPNRNQYNSFGMKSPSNHQNKFLQQPRSMNLKKDEAAVTGGASVVNPKSMSHQFGTKASGAADMLDTSKEMKPQVSNSSVAPNLSSSIFSATDNPEQFKVSGGASGSVFSSGKYNRQSIDAQQPKPQVIQNQGSAHQPAKRIQGRLTQVKPYQMNLKVMGFPIQPDQQFQTTAGTHGLDSSLNEDLLEMTPEQNKDKYQKRIAPNQGKTQSNSIFLSLQDQPVIRQPDDENPKHRRRAESMGKQKLHSKFSNKAADEHAGGIEGLIQVKNLQQPLAQQRGGKKQRHHKSVHGAIHRGLKNNNAPFKPMHTTSTTNSQLNDSGHGSGGGNAPVALQKIGNINIGSTSANFGFSATQSSEQESHHLQVTNSQVKSRRQHPVTSANPNPVILLHPFIANSRNPGPQAKPKQWHPQLSPAPRSNHKVSQTQQPPDEELLMSGGDRKARELHNQFKENPSQPQQLRPQNNISPKSSVKQTPQHSHRKRETKLVFRDDKAPLGGAGAGMKTERDRPHVPPQFEAASVEETRVVKESVKRRKLKKQIDQSKHLNQLKITSFESQERDGSQSAGSVGENIPSKQQTTKTHAHKLQQKQERILRSKEDFGSSSDDTLSREEGGGQTGAMDIVQGFTPSGLAASSTANQNQSYPAEIQPTEEQIQDPKEFTIDEETKDRVIVKQVKDLNSNQDEIHEQKPATATKEQQLSYTLQQPNKKPTTEQKKGHQLYSKANNSKEKQRSENFSKHQSSSDQSFQQAFEQLLAESANLRRQYEEILIQRLTPNDHKYTEFVHKVLDRTNQYYKSMPLQRSRKENLFENNNIFTTNRVVQHIENEKKRRYEHITKPFHSDMSRSKFYSNSVRDENPSITSPNFSGTHQGIGLRAMQLHFPKHYRKRRLTRYFSISNGVTYHARSAQQASNLLPELSGGRYRNSLCHLNRPFGISDSLSQQRFQRAINSSNSNQTVPTPIRQENQKLEDIKDGINRAQIFSSIPAVDGAQPNAGTLLDANRDAANRQPTFENPHVQKIYEKFNLNDRDRRAQQIKEFFPQKLQRAENNFFPPETVPAAVPKILGNKIQWQIGSMLGSGTTGEVYEAQAINLDEAEVIAVKMVKLMHPIHGLDQQKLKAVKKEIQRYRELKHRHIVKYYDSEIIENNVLCIYLEYQPTSIVKVYTDYEKIGEGNARRYTRQVLKALEYLHRNNVIHGDLKGANLLVNKDGTEIKLCDLGNSLMINTTQPTVDMRASFASVVSIKSLFSGSPAWQAPETQSQKVGRKSDIWSLGCLVVEMVTGQNPWGTRLEDEGSVHLTLQRLFANRERPDIPTDVSPECQSFILRCLQHDVKERPSAEVLLDDPWIKNKEHATIMSPRRQ